MSPRKIPADQGMAAIHSLTARGDGPETPSTDIALAVRYALQTLRERSPGKSVEVRVPPYGAVQILEGATHSRGTPPAVVEMSPEALLALATGTGRWEQLVDRGVIIASGERSDLRGLFPLWPLG